MSQLEIGQMVKIQCDIQPGPFADERLVTVETIQGPISGFADSASLVDIQGESGYILGRIVSFGPDSVTVHLYGSFFTTNGLADLSSDRPLAA